MKGPILKTRMAHSLFGQYTQYQCPACKKWMNRHAKSVHITRKAQNEEKKKTAGIISKTPHLNFYLKHTREVVKVRRVWEVIL